MIKRFTYSCASILLFFIYSISYIQAATRPGLAVSFPPLEKSANHIISAHKPNYISPLHYIAYNEKDIDYYAAGKQPSDLKEFEVAFQLGAKALLCSLEGVTQSKSIGFYGAYTQQSYWQVYAPSPFFRATDYKPEFFVEIPLVLDGKSSSLRIGYLHQSNGLGINGERSWDRIYLSSSIQLPKYPLEFLLKVWHIRNDGKNPDIGEYLGYGKIVIAYSFSNQHQLLITKRLSMKDWEKTGEIQYLFPIIPAVQGIVKGFAGYGENIMNYKHPTYSFLLGINLRFT